MKLKAVSASIVAACAALSLGSSVAMANTSAGVGGSPTSGGQSVTQPAVQVLHSAYIIRQPRLYSGRIQLEPVGTELKLLAGGNRYWYHVQAPDGKTGYITTTSYYTKQVNQVIFSLPPGVTLDPSITPIAPITASNAAKFAAILQVAQSKLGTPYRLDHNEDRGQYGFDCSNFAEYVYHHALGYSFTTSSIKQYQSVGTPVPISDMQPGDLLCFNDGGHVGIYVGNGQMIQCGGGLAKVGYLSVAPGSYWYNHLSAVKRMF
ncbi:hypothetical protein Alches_06940 [Alicyclobacillus hesperidum subsp. aegles]|uniref:C40 family peptidase n=1 Tax=Alicyclobacillus hesperidum TaxID=89784 RepID=UPI002228DD6A|nr:C40 family peptidase [Alicyclobacillus hesperidum]GLG00655.1 hypothetical protein Alches_06940 [Alicyclobacillus hesperidum subsp. aegles]